MQNRELSLENNEKIKIALIKPTIGTKLKSLYIDEGRMEPLQLGIIGAILSNDFDVMLFDDRFEKIDYVKNFKYAFITVETFTAKRAYEISKECKNRGIKTIMGGMHAVLATDEIMQHCDCVVTGDAETTFNEIISDIKNNSLKKIYRGTVAAIPQKNIITKRDLFKNKGYLPITLLQFSRGCIHNCNYCATSQYFCQKHYTRDINEVIKEIEMQNRKYLFFVDDNFVANKQKAKELLRALIPLKVKWVSQGSIDMLQDKELMELIVKSGCLGFVIGFESINENSLDFMNKKINKLKGFDKFQWEIEQFRNYGLQNWVSFTIGHDTDTIDTIKETYKFALHNKFTFAAFNVLMPYPNTPLYKKLEEEKRLLYNGKWWLDENYKFNYAAYIPKNMTPDELTELGKECRYKFNSLKSLLYRMTDLKTNMSSLERFMLYWMYAPIFKKEVFKKHGMFFGLNRFFKRGLQ